MKVLIVEDNLSIGRNISQYLKIKWVENEIVTDGKNALFRASTDFFDAMVLDIGLPEVDGLEVCRMLREKGKDIPILFLTSRSARNDIINGLKKGADDYMVKPFDFEELLIRLEVLTRRNLKNKSTTKIIFWEYEMDVEEISFKKWNISIHLSTLEFNLLKYLLQNKGRTLSKEELYEKVWWEYDIFKMWKTVDVYIGYLRKKLWKDIIETKKWMGYTLWIA
jgi:two-component system, OmpR family, response regulator